MPVAQKLSPTLEDVRRLAPNLRNLFYDLRVLQPASLKGLPALRSFLIGLAPVLDELEHFLANFNPILRYLEYQKATVADFLTGPAASMSGALDGFPGDPARRHFLRQLTVTGTETLSIHPNRLNTNRGNGYLADGVLNASGAQGIFPSFDCRNTDYRPFDPAPDTDEEELRVGQTDPDLNMGNPPGASYAPCWIQGDFPGGAAFGDGDRGVEIREDP